MADTLHLIAVIVVDSILACAQYYDASYNYEHFYLPRMFPTGVLLKCIGKLFKYELEYINAVIILILIVFL